MAFLRYLSFPLLFSHFIVFLCVCVVVVAAYSGVFTVVSLWYCIDWNREIVIPYILKGLGREVDSRGIRQGSKALR